MKKIIIIFIVLDYFISNCYTQFRPKLLYSDFKDTTFTKSLERIHKGTKNFMTNEVFNDDYTQFEFFVTIKMDSTKKEFNLTYLEPAFLPVPIKLRNYCENLFKKGISKTTSEYWKNNESKIFLVRCLTQSKSFKINKSDSLLFEKRLDLSGTGNLDKFVLEEEKNKHFEIFITF